ncbi:hypothetical protein [Nocardia asteroides]|uniref:hypothetical protein n=1 Tax=Nocardia asteroides TaxID=1824 RepID=UPI001E43C817|nr:hypothetical protein [Nocardia asteroides]UGT53358.1 hypothetical protein LTT85_22060 [Nocardia asteroides]
MYATPTPNVLASALHRVFADSALAPDSLELWIAVADAAVRELQMPVMGALVPWVPIALHYEQATTDGEFFPHSGSVRIMTGPLSGTLYRDLETATREVVVAVRDHLAEQDGDDTGDDGQTDIVRTVSPSWRFRAAGASAGFTPRVVPPLTS